MRAYPPTKTFSISKVESQAIAALVSATTYNVNADDFYKEFFTYINGLPKDINLKLIINEAVFVIASTLETEIKPWLYVELDKIKKAFPELMI